MRRPLIVSQILAALLGAGLLFVLLTLPPKAARLPVTSDRPIVYGAFHIHSNRSDGTGTPDQIAAAAARAGLHFIVLTDHGDGTRTPDPPEYRHGVLCIDAVELGTAAGHLVAIGLPEGAPYPLAGEARDVIEDVHRLGGWVSIAHPDSPKPELRWRAWNVDFDALEWLNVDSEWRDKSASRLAGTMARYLFRSPESIAMLFERPVRTLQRWDATGRQREVVGIAAVDAHARGLVWNEGGSGGSGWTMLARPSYQEMFRTVNQAVVLPEFFSRNAVKDAAMLLTALKAGQTYSVMAAQAMPATLIFRGTQEGEVAVTGGRLTGVGSPVTFEAEIANAPGARVAIRRNGAEIAASRGRVTYSGRLDSGSYRVEATYAGAAAPWVVSNPIYAGERPAASARPEGPGPLRLVPLPTGGEWTVEQDRSSSGKVSAEDQSTRFDFALGGGKPAGQYAALVSALAGDAAQEGFDRVQFVVRADRPMRLSVQVRLPGGRDARWRHSIYADTTPRTVVLSIQDFIPVEGATTQRPIVARLRSVLFVVDTVNTATGSRGSFWLSAPALGVGNTER